jgi:hypothetical protein
MRRALEVVVLILLLTPIILLSIGISQTSASAGVEVITGPTPIMEGEAKGPGDVTLMNEYLAVAFGISTTPPWGIPPGHIIDIAPVGEKTQDVVAQFSFPLNDWGNWAKITEFSIVERGPLRAVVKAIGYWKDLRVEYTYILESGKPYLEVAVNVTNVGSTTYSNLIMGPAITFERGWTFVPGFGTGRLPTMPILGTSIMDDWVAGYHEDYAIGLYAPNYTHISLHTFFVDPFYSVTLNPGESRVFKAYIVVLNKPDTCRLAEIIYGFKNLSVGYVEGFVSNNKGQRLEGAGVVAYRGDKPYCWSITEAGGAYRMPLPAPNSYNLTAVAKAHGPSSRVGVTLGTGETAHADFTDLTVPGKITVNVFRNDTGKPVDAQIIISGGYVPPIQYMAVTTAYTGLYDVGHAEIEIAPGSYNVTVNYGVDFISLPKTIPISVESEKTVGVNVTVDVLFKPEEYGWYSIDLHHHSNYLDGKTPPDLLVVAQLAAALDFTFVSDHDYVGNCPVIKEYSSSRGVPFICGVEISPDWAHFNVYPVIYPDKLVYRGTLKEIIEGAKKAGALVIRANHPYIGGLFIAQELNNIPGGYYEEWDVAEINGPWGTDDNKTLTKMFTLWSSGVHKYLTAGSDVHDVLTQTYTGKPRLVAYLPSGPSTESLAEAEKYGHSFISYGPLIFTNPLPGSTMFVGGLDGELKIALKLFSVNGLDRLEVYGKYGRLIGTIPLNKSQSLDLEVKVLASEATNGTENGFIVFIAYDTKGNRAIVNPIWIDMYGVPREVTHTTTSTVTETSTITSTYTEKVTQTTTIKEISTATYTETSTITQTTTFTHRETTTTTQTSEVVRYDTTIALALVTLIIGFTVGFTARRKK